MPLGSVRTALVARLPFETPDPGATGFNASAVKPGHGAAHPMFLLARSSRWSGSAWAFERQGIGSSLSPGGSLGGSQLGARLGFRINDDPARPLAISGRLYAPRDDFDAAEAAAGIEWQPLRQLPVRLLAERRQALGSKGRSAFSLLAHGGISGRRLAGPVLVDGYAQAGVVGARSRDLFADWSLRLGVAVDDRIKIGLGAWGAAQPGIARLDAGPQASVRLPLAGASVTLAADWRFRVAGDASPGSGPALTLSTDF